MDTKAETLLRETIGRVAPLDESLGEVAQRRLDMLTKPQGSLGRLEDMARQLVQITGSTMPSVERKVVFTFAGDHGVADEGVSAFPREVTPQMVLNFLAGGAGINVLARHSGAEVAVIDIGVDHDFEDVEGLLRKKIVRGTRNIARGPAMTRDEALRCIEVGIGLADEFRRKGFGLFGTGEMGIANTTPSSAIAAVLTGRSAAEVTGRGTGITDASLRKKAEVVARAVEINAPDPRDPLDVLSKLGGAEIGGIAGLCIGGAANRVPVVVDGFISTAGALVACELEPRVKHYLFAAHRSAERGHGAMLEKLGLRPILDLDMRLGEGTGAALAMLVIEAGLKVYREMATFSDAGVSEREA